MNGYTKKNKTVKSCLSPLQAHAQLILGDTSPTATVKADVCGEGVFLVPKI